MLMFEPGFWIRFVLATLATWRVTHLIAAEDGPGDVLVRLRARLGRSFAGALMDCFNCLSIWIAAPAGLFVTRRPLDWLFVWLAVSGAACLLERLGEKPVEIPPMSETSEGEAHDVLWSEAVGASGSRAAHGSVTTGEAAPSSADERTDRR